MLSTILFASWKTGIIFRTFRHFEAKTDNQIHNEFLKKAGEITEDNYLHALFGPDVNIIDYNFEVVVYDDGVEKEEA